MDIARSDLKRAQRILGELIMPERSFIKVAVIYGVLISLLTLSVPIAVQILINTVANIASVRAILILSSVLLAMLLLSGFLTAMRTRVMEMYERHVYARLAARIGVNIITAPHKVFEGRRSFALTHRYFDIMTLQKNIPALVVDGFALVLQLAVGFTLVSFYHPMLFAFNLLILILIYLNWLLFNRGARRTALRLSRAKYDTAKWLSSIAAAHEFFQSGRHLDYAGVTSEQKISEYVTAHRGHFRYTFSQLIVFLLIYAVASAALLGLGGWLVIQGELSIGQLVAAELIMFAVFFGLTQCTNYLKMYYELYGAADKLGQVLELPKENLDKNFVAVASPDNSGSLQCQELEYSRKDKSDMKVSLSFTLEAGAKAFVITEQGWIQRDFIKLLKLQKTPDRGWLRIGGRELSDYDSFGLRHDVFFVDRSLIIDCTIKEYLLLAAPEATAATATTILDQLELSDHIHNLPDKLDTRLSSLGAPLMAADFLLLKIAAAILAKPKLVVLHQDVDNLPGGFRRKVLEVVSRQEFSVLYFTNLFANLSNGQLPDQPSSHPTDLSSNPSTDSSVNNPEQNLFDGVLQLNCTEPGNGSEGVIIAPGSNSPMVTT